MHYITKEQYQKLVDNKIQYGEGEIVSWGDCVIPFGPSERRIFSRCGIRLMQLDSGRPNYAYSIERSVSDAGTEHEDIYEHFDCVKIKVIRSKFLFDLTLTYEYWRHRRMSHIRR